MACKAECPKCKKFFKTYPSWLRNGNRYCSSQCKKQATLERNTRICGVCEKSFLSNASRHNAKYCSYQCYGIAQRAPVNYNRKRYTLKQEQEILFKSCSKFCKYCNVELDFQKRNNPNGAVIDHVISLADGGSNTIDNKQVICFTCNSKKQDWDEDSFYSSLINQWIEMCING